MLKQYQVIEYTGIDKSQDGNWVITEINKSDYTMFISEETAPRDICQFLKKEGILDSADMKKLLVTDLDRDIIEVKFKKEKKPICRLVRRS